MHDKTSRVGTQNDEARCDFLAQSHIAETRYLVIKKHSYAFQPLDKVGAIDGKLVQQRKQQAEDFSSQLASAVNLLRLFQLQFPVERSVFNDVSLRYSGRFPSEE